MTFTTFISKLNWRQIIVHALGIYLFMYAFTILACLKSVRLIDALYVSKQSHDQKGFSSYDWQVYITWPYYGALIGGLFAFILALYLSIKHKWFWVNAFVAYQIVYLTNRYDVSGWSYIKTIFLAPGNLFTSTTLKFLVNGSFMLIIALLCFFSKKSFRFIENGNKLNKVNSLESTL